MGSVTSAIWSCCCVGVFCRERGHAFGGDRELGQLAEGVEFAFDRFVLMAVGSAGGHGEGEGSEILETFRQWRTSSPKPLLQRRGFRTGFIIIARIPP